MTVQMICDIVRRQYPEISLTEILQHLNDGVEKFVLETMWNFPEKTGFFSKTTVANQSYYALSSFTKDGITTGTEPFNIENVWLDNTLVPKYIGEIEPLDTV